MSRVGLRTALFLTGLMFVCAQLAWGQAITGTVTDPSGNVIPGAEVEASSPALIEQHRTVITDGAGRYTIVDLEPGPYTVTVTQPGFSTLKRGGIVLTTDFTALVNLQLQVGQVSETVTVEAAAPTVDTQAVTTTRLMTAPEMEALPTGRDLTSMLNLIPGGGTQGFGSPAFRGQTDALTTVDGARTTNMIGAGPGLTTGATSNSSIEEMTFSNGMDSAEMATAGIRINIIPKNGGNEFHGNMFATYTRSGWSGNNIDQELAEFPAQLQNPKTIKLWDINPSLGGPIIKNKLWFQGTFQTHSVASTALGSYANAAPGNPLDFTPDLVNLVHDSTKSYVGTGRLTYQATSKDNLSVYYEQGDTDRPFARLPSFIFFGLTEQADATSDLNTHPKQFVAKWTRVQSPRLLFDASFSIFNQTIANDIAGQLNAWSARYNDEQGVVRPAVIALSVGSFLTGRIYNQLPQSDYNWSKTRTIDAAASYVTGSHSLKAGLSLLWGSYYRPSRTPGDATITRFFGPPSLTLRLPLSQTQIMDADLGIYIQDKWTIKRLTLNLGGRFDIMRTHTPDETLPASIWLPSSDFKGVDVLHWNDFSPRIGVAYDLFGNGKTALRLGIGRFVDGETVNITTAVNPTSLISTTSSALWRDLNGDGSIYNPDGTLQSEEIGPPTNANFGKIVQSTTYDPEVLEGWAKRGYSWNVEGGVSQQLFGRLTVNATAYYRWTGNRRVTINQALKPTDFDPYCAHVPADSLLPGGGNYDVCGLYDQTPSSLAIPPKNLVTFAENVGSKIGILNVTNGFELNVRGQFGHGAFIQGGMEFRRIVYDDCDTRVVNPQMLYCRSVTPYLPNYRLSGGYILPLDIQVAGTYYGNKSQGGLFSTTQTGIGATWNPPINQTTLGRPSSSPFGLSVPVVNPYAEYLQVWNQFDMRFSKIFTIKEKYKIAPAADLFNIFNLGGISGVNQTYSSPSQIAANPTTKPWKTPTAIGPSTPRQFRLSVNFIF